MFVSIYYEMILMEKRRRKRWLEQRSSKTRPTSFEKKSPQSDQELDSRREFLRKALIGGAGIGSAILLKNGKGLRTKRSSTEEKASRVRHVRRLVRREIISSEELEAQKKIERIEIAFTKFGEKLFEKLKNSPDRERLEKWFRVPFEYMKMNKRTNRARNILTFKRERNLKGKNFVFNHKMSKYFYAFKDKDYDDAAASFDPPARRMDLSDGFEPENEADLLVLFHELLHVHYDSQLRASINTEEGWRRYRSLYFYDPKKEKPKLNIIDEGGAVALELEAMNVLLDGELKRAIQNGEPINKREILRKFGATKLNQIGPLSFNLNFFAEAYFKDGEKFRGYPKALLDQIADAARRRGTLVWMPVENGSMMVPYSK
jgi:hypothetical protein